MSSLSFIHLVFELILDFLIFEFLILNYKMKRWTRLVMKLSKVPEQTEIDNSWVYFVEFK